MTDAEIGGKATGLAYIGAIKTVEAIPNADKIVRIEAFCADGGTWSAIAQKDEFRVGSRCEVYLQDALLPKDNEKFAFMEKYKYRVRMIRLRGVPSEALVLPLDISTKGDIGDDITGQMGVTKYEKPLPASLGGKAAGYFPSFIPKTDEVNFQKVPELVEEMQRGIFYITEKADGISCTFFHNDGHFGVCSRRIEYQNDTDSLYWRLARKYNMPEILPKLGNIAIQAEGVGPGIQGNPMGLDDIEIRVFDVYDIDKQMYYNGSGVVSLCADYNWPMVQVVKVMPNGMSLTSEDWRKLAEGTYANGEQREGIVVRPFNERMVGQRRLSFKVINLLYKG